MSMHNVIELSSLNARSRSRTIDKRLHPRLECNDRLFTQIVLSPDDPGLVGTTLACRAVNFSVGGIQFSSTTAVPPGTLLDLWVDVANLPGKFFLSGEVRWTRVGGLNSDGEQLWYVGVQLRPGAATDFQQWRDYLSRVSSG